MKLIYLSKRITFILAIESTRLHGQQPGIAPQNPLQVREHLVGPGPK